MYGGGNMNRITAYGDKSYKEKVKYKIKAFDSKGNVVVTRNATSEYQKDNTVKDFWKLGATSKVVVTELSAAEQSKK